MAFDSIQNDRPIVTRKEAMAAGLRHYFTGKPCPSGHIDTRHVGGGCLACAREKSRNPDLRLRRRELEHKARQSPEFLAKKAAYMREYRKSPQVKESIQAYKKKYLAANPPDRERAKEKTREWLIKAKTNPEWVEKERARGRERTKNDPDGNRAKRHRYRARARGNGGNHGPEDVARILNRQKYKCVYCFEDIRETYEVDHIMPLALGGSNWPANLQCTCRDCNRSKGAKHPLDFAKQKGRLV